MNIFVNDQSITVAALCNVEQLLQQLQSPLTGCAVAVNQNIISRSLWAECQLNEGDQIALFQAIAGG